MNFPFAMPLMLLLLQSNELVARAVQQHGILLPDLEHYKGITGAFGAIFIMLITWLGNFVHNYGLAIVISAIIVRLALLYLTRQQIYGMKTMQMLQPVMKMIQRYYPNRNDQSAKTMELYSQYKINPLAGCLPLFIQLPIMFGVYRALYDASFVGKDFLGIQLLFPVNITAGRSFSGGPDLADLIDLTVYKLGLQGQILHIPERVPFLGGGAWYWPALILVALYVASSFFMQRVMRKVNAPHPEFEEEFKAELKAPDGAPQQPDMAAQMQKQMGLMNLMIVVFAFIFSSGALLYFIAQNLLMALEYTLLPRTMSFAYNAKELKEFVRKPPPPLKTAGQAKPRNTQSAPQSANSKGEEGIDVVANQDGDLDDREDFASLKRPRRKRRKK